MLAAASALGVLGITGALADGAAIGDGAGHGVVVDFKDGSELWIDGQSQNPGPTAGYAAVHIDDMEVLCGTNSDPTPYEDSESLGAETPAATDANNNGDFDGTSCPA